MRTSIFILLFAFFGLYSHPQVLSDEAMRYWYYRDRLQYFVYPGAAEGNSILMNGRNSKGYTGDVEQFNGSKWGQTHKINGFYLGLLATEYRLLMNNGQYLDAETTLHELDLALDALIRIDKCEDIEPWYNSYESFDGFFIRSDVSPVLSTDMTEYLNQNLPSGDYNDYVQEFNQRPGYPFAIDPTVVFCPRRYESSLNYYYNNPFHDEFLDIQTDYVYNPNSYNNNSAYWKYWKSDKFTSNDEIIYMYMGLALVGKYVDDQEVLDKARDIATKIRNFAIINPCGAALNRFFIMHYPDCNRIKESNGGNSVGFLYGLIGACAKINGTNGSLTSILSSMNLPYLGLMFAYSQGINIYSNFPDPISGIINLPFTDPAYPTSFDIASYNRYLFSVLVAISDRTGSTRKSYRAISDLGVQNEVETFYMLLWAAINDKDLTKVKYNFRDNVFLEQLLTAPCEGPYYYNDPSLFPPGWASQYKFGSSLSTQYGTDNDFSGVFPGVDYMLLYNLACLAFPNGFETDDGTNYYFPYYVNQNNRSVTDEYAPMVLPGNNSVEIASTNNPEEIRAISSITTNMVISNRALMLTPAWLNAGQGHHYVDNVNGDVTLIAGESIRLTDGFRVDAGAHFLAKIESYSCNGLPYKNMNAPPWNENYRASFYDTLISVPRDQRIPIVYTDDDYSYVDYDTPLWDDYYNLPDTGFIPELPLSAFLTPNPCSNKSTLYIKPTSDQYLSIELFDICTQQGAIIFEGNSGRNNFEIEIDMTMYSAGIYIIRISGTNAVKILKLMRE